MTGTRALSTVVSYALVIAITLALTTSLVLGSESMIENQREDAVREQLSVIGQQLASTVSTADRLNATDTDPTDLAVTRRLPDRVAGSQYRILVAESDAGPDLHTIYLAAVDLDVNVSVSVRTTASDLQPTRVNGGDLQVSYDEPTERLVIGRA